eukprot:c29114_g1_i3 orf=321-2291(+)
MRLWLSELGTAPSQLWPARMGEAITREGNPAVAHVAAAASPGEGQPPAASSTRWSCDDIETTLAAAEETVKKWDFETSEEARQSLLWEDRPDEVPSYLDAVDSIWGLLESLSLEPSHRRDSETVDRAQNALQLAMSRLEEELSSLLEKHSESVDPDWLFDPVSGPSFGSTTDDIASQSSDEGEKEETATSYPIAKFDFPIDMLPPEIVPDLSIIATRMVAAGYKTECCQVYISIRKAVLEESISRLGLEKLSIEEVQKMLWEILEREIAKWIQATKVALGVLFPSEKQLCDQVFTDLPLVSEYCFAELARGAMMQLLNFGEAIAISRRSPEKLFKILDMYETLRDLIDKINSIFCGPACLNVRSEAMGILTRLGEDACGTFAEFENAVQRETSKSPVPGGAVHPLTRYVMNYMRFLSDYTDTLNGLLDDRSSGAPMSTDESALGSVDFLSEDTSPLSARVVSLIQHLENNLEGKSKMYRDPALSFLFMMNNCNYVVQKVKDSEVRTLLGDDWIRRHTGKVRQYHNGYQRAAWSKVLSCLRDEGIHVSGGFTSGVSRTVLKERFKNFNAAFEEIIKTQSTWIVSDSQLRTELQIAIAEMLLPAYRSFLGRFRNHLDLEKNPEKYLKYTTDELEAYLHDLFEGSSGSMNRRKSFSTAA